MWFRSDLRTLDNTALHHASRAAQRGTIALFVISPGQWRQHDYAGVKVDLILRTLQELSAELARFNIPLLIRTAPTLRDVPGVVASVVREHACDALFFNKEYEVDEARRDAQTIALVEREGAKAHPMTDQSLIEPGEVRTGSGTFFTVFSPFKRAAYRYLESHGLGDGVREWPAPKHQTAAPAGLRPDAVPTSVEGFATTVPAETWPAGERAALSRLRTFAERSIVAYKERRDFPAIDGTSMLSPALCIGTISPRQCLASAVRANREALAVGKSPLDTGPAGITHWISEVLWREFYIHVMVGFPRVCMGRAFQAGMDAVAWNDNPVHLKAWQHGRTGVPIVDAGMRQLQAMGWMHNRVRMIVAMYLSKNLLLDWRLGEKWFMQHLVDGFLASNNGGWQWSASTGTDAAPYFRIFNPVTQSQNFDPKGEYIRTYVPELRGLESEALHAPWTLPPLLRGKLDYPDRPLVDLSKSRQAAIEAFQRVKGAPVATRPFDDA